MQRNYDLQKEIDAKMRQQTLAELETQTLAYQQKYYRTSEYQELAIRERLGLVSPSESALLLPPNSQAAVDAGKPTEENKAAPASTSNFEQWANFLFGGNHAKIKE
jgi:hypothetical protein